MIAEARIPERKNRAQRIHEGASPPNRRALRSTSYGTNRTNTPDGSHKEEPGRSKSREKSTSSCNSPKLKSPVRRTKSNDPPGSRPKEKRPLPDTRSTQDSTKEPVRRTRSNDLCAKPSTHRLRVDTNEDRLCRRRNHMKKQHSLKRNMKTSELKTDANRTPSDSGRRQLLTKQHSLSRITLEKKQRAPTVARPSLVRRQRSCQLPSRTSSKGKETLLRKSKNDGRNQKTLPKKTVTFGSPPKYCTVHTYECPLQDCLSKWYCSQDLEELLKYEVQICQRRATRKHKDTHYTKRGIERLLDGKRGLEKFLDGRQHRHLYAPYVKSILEAQSKLQNFDDSTGMNTVSEQDRLHKRAEATRLFSKEQTNEHRQRAYKLGFQDASDAKSIINRYWKNSAAAQPTSLVVDTTRSLANTTMKTINTSMRNLNAAACQATESILSIPTASLVVDTTRSLANTTMQTINTSMRNLNTTAGNATESILSMAKSPTTAGEAPTNKATM